jgi:hypothetical protein
LHALPADFQERAYDLKAFARARKILSPLQLMQLVLLYYGPDLSLRSCAGEVAKLQGYLSDMALTQRLSACGAWLKSLLKTLVPFIDRGGHVVLRYNPHSMTLYERGNESKGVKIDWDQRIRDLNDQPGAIQVHLCHQDNRIEGVVYALPLPPEQASQARRKAKH